MQKLMISTGTYINLMKDLDMYVIVNEGNTVDYDSILEATEYLEDFVEGKNLSDVNWSDVARKLEDIFPCGVHVVQKKG